jgi:uncharacterized membrane protein YfcA
MAWVADILTAARVPLAVILAAAVAADQLETSIVILMAAWMTDALDGRAARASRKTTYLGDWDFRVDMTVCAGILTGIAIAGRGSIWLVSLIVLVGMGSSIVTCNPSPAMFFMGVSYAWFFGILLTERPGLWWLPFAAIAALLVLDWKRFTTVILPAFFKGAAHVIRREAADTPPVLDRWA